MKIDVIVTDNNDSWSGIQTYLIPDEIMKLNIFFFKEGEKNTTLCRLQIQYNEKQDAIIVYKWLTG